jgi:ribosomal protein S18 acetylase RimI-like enzyme
VSLLAANETVKELYERIGFKEIPEKEESMYLVRPIAVSHGGKQII